MITITITDEDLQKSMAFQTDTLEELTDSDALPGFRKSKGARTPITWMVKTFKEELEKIK